MTDLTDFLAGRAPTEMYETYWVPCNLWPFAISLVEHVSPGDQVLDVGAGTGLLTELASARTGGAGHVTALEPTPFMIELLRRKYQGAPQITLIDGSIEDCDLGNDMFDVVLCHQVVQYITDLPAAMNQMRRLAKPGGKVVIGVWSGAQDQAMSVLEDGYRKHLGEDFVPIHAWSFGGLERLKSLVEDAGMEVTLLEKQVQTYRFKSVEELLKVFIVGGMRVEGDDVLMGIFDLEDESYVPKVRALLSDLQEELAANEGADGLSVPCSSDVVIARA